MHALTIEYMRINRPQADQHHLNMLDRAAHVRAQLLHDACRRTLNHCLRETEFKLRLVYMCFGWVCPCVGLKRVLLV